MKWTIKEYKRLKAFERSQKWYLHNKDRKKQYDLRYNIKNRKKRNLKSVEWVKANKEARKTHSKKYYESNKNKIFANMAARRARILNAMPKWLTKENKQQIKNIYKNRPKGFHVDHIDPLKGKNVCGLHVPWNLQYLSAEENLRKGTKHV